MDAHSRVRYMLHKCNRARREHVASNMLFYISSQPVLDSQLLMHLSLHLIHSLVGKKVYLVGR